LIGSFSHSGSGKPNINISLPRPKDNQKAIHREKKLQDLDILLVSSGRGENRLGEVIAQAILEG